MEPNYRYLDGIIRHLVPLFPAILVSGPRQSGKTTLVSRLARELFGDQLTTVDLGIASELDAFRRDPTLFFANRPGVLLLESVSNAPELFLHLARGLQRGDGEFRYLMTSGVHPDRLTGLPPAVAGRMASVELWPMVQQEIRRPLGGAPVETMFYLEDPERLEELLGRCYEANDSDVVQAMLSGGFPPVALDDRGGLWLEAYRRTFLQGAGGDLSPVADPGRFDRFVTLCAGRSGTVLNKAELGRQLDVDHRTIDHWLERLRVSYQAVSLAPIPPVGNERLVRRRKWLFADSGLGCRMQGIRDASGLLNAPHFHHLFVAFVIMELVKLWGHAGLPWPGHFWKTPRGLECDLVLQIEGRLIPLAIRHTGTPGRRDVAALHRFLDRYRMQASHGILITLDPEVRAVDRRVYHLPLGMILDGPEPVVGASQE